VTRDSENAVTEAAPDLCTDRRPFGNNHPNRVPAHSKRQRSGRRRTWVAIVEDISSLTAASCR